MQEWRILKTHLPDTIYVRAYENRIDLMRAAIVGAAGTPYHDGIFFFDIAFPADYPARPPLIHYRSFGLRINPNLYASGLVCLSLLNTWHGKKSEIWSPSGSTMLQVLVSIQGLVLNEKPYYNEPGTGVWPGRGYWDKRSNAYSEDVFVLCCKTMMFLMRRAPKNFEGFVADHFRVTAPAILSACKAYMEGRASVGHYYASNVVDHDGSSSSSSLVQVSDKFKGAMRKLFPDLVDAFARSGASVGNFVEQVAVERNANPRDVVDRKKKGGMGKWVWGKLKNALGFKKKKKNSGKNKASSSK
ncbi:hypothetical protein Tsubulata_039373 [Turnera subulata]|uniref:UBC core domain-containing protein n=1 Tax=Turnera subulata TaxID=218843 RepID=A0A9Q0J2F7_9ROSI|nr:hypothetical protein Tsubulata_039373 [Turnera subulata]